MKSGASAKSARGRPRRFDHDTALASAMELFWERGFEATSMSELTEAMGMSPSSIYSTWGDKLGLFVAALDRYVSGPGAFSAQALACGDTAREAVSLMLQRAAAELTQDGRPSGCLVALSGNQCSPAAQATSDALVSLRLQSKEKIAARLRAGQQAGEFGPGIDATELAEFYATVLSGMSIQARNGATSEQLGAVARRAMRAWPAV